MKKQSRRTFLAQSAKASLFLPFAGSTLLSCEQQTNSETNQEDKETTKLRILILGGTSFLGPHQVAYALSRGHQVSTFTRGKTKSTVHEALFDQVKQLIGDRENDLTALENREWDVVIDNSGRKAEWTQRTAELLKEKAGLYLYVSSTGVFYPYQTAGVTEAAEVVLEMPDNLEDEEMKLEYGYGVMKANSEIAARTAFGEDRTIVVRPTYMIGPADKTNRFIHWPLRLSRGGETLVPGKADDPIQYLDVRDAAEWMIRLAEEKKSGTYNAAGPKEQQGMRSFVEEASGAFEATSSFVQVDDYAFLKENNIHYLVPWIMLEGYNRETSTISNAKAIRNGLTFRPLTTTVKDTYDWWNSDSIPQKLRDEVEQDPDSLLNREKTVLEAWRVK